MNFPLPEVQDGAQYRETLHKAIQLVRDFHPAFLVVALGLDPAKGDPTGSRKTAIQSRHDLQLHGNVESTIR